MCLVRLDHVIYSVPDIEAAHRELTARFPEAWPIGRFWPDGRTSGVAIGGINLELIQIDGTFTGKSTATTLAFEPSSPEEAERALKEAGLNPYVVDKIEPNSELLKLRGFSEAECQSPQRICTNVIPGSPFDAPFGFFCCSYSPFLKQWLSPDHSRLSTEAQVVRIVYGTPVPNHAKNLLTRLGYQGGIAIDFVSGDTASILSIETNYGPLDWPRPLG